MARGITIVSPMWGERKITDRMIFSVLHQFKSSENPYKIHLVLVDDYIEGRLENNKSYYEYYLSEEFKQFYDPDFIEIELIINDEHKYQGESREIGFMAGKYKYFLLIDCDDMLAPNACDKYLCAIQQNNKEKGLPLAYVTGLVYGFDTRLYEQLIQGESIWVQGRCYNRDFIIKHNIHFGTGLSSRQGEDYPFIQKIDYALDHDSGYQIISLNQDPQNPPQCTAYWFPNENSLSRKDPHYGQHLSGWTLKSSGDILDYFEEFNEEHEIESEEDESFKARLLNMTIYGFYNVLDFLKEVASTDYKPLEEDWIALKDAINHLRDKLKNKYWNEIIYSMIEDNLYQVHYHSDVHFTESWIGTFYDFINKEQPILNMNYQEMLEYCETLKFDENGHEIHSPQVVAWQKRHNIK